MLQGPENSTTYKLKSNRSSKIDYSINIFHCLHVCLATMIDLQSSFFRIFSKISLGNTSWIIACNELSAISWEWKYPNSFVAYELLKDTEEEMCAHSNSIYGISLRLQKSLLIKNNWVSCKSQGNNVSKQHLN